MANYSRARRAGATSLAGRRRARDVAGRLGTAVREARLSIGATQAAIAERARVSQPYLSVSSEVAATASIEVWASLAAAVGLQLAAFLEAMPGATRPRDYEHLRRQQLIIALAAEGGWGAKPELAIDHGPGRSRSIDVYLERPATGETIVVEVWDFFDDVGAALRGLDGKLSAVAGRDAAGRDAAVAEHRVRGLFVVRGTQWNRALVREFGGIFRARFGGSSGAAIASLGDPSQPFPLQDALAWTDLAGTRLIAARLGG